MTCIWRLGVPYPLTWDLLDTHLLQKKLRNGNANRPMPCRSSPELNRILGTKCEKHRILRASPIVPIPSPHP